MLIFSLNVTVFYFFGTFCFKNLEWKLDLFHLPEPPLGLETEKLLVSTLPLREVIKSCDTLDSWEISYWVCNAWCCMAAAKILAGFCS